MPIKKYCGTRKGSVQNGRALKTSIRTMQCRIGAWRRRHADQMPPGTQFAIYYVGKLSQHLCALVSSCAKMVFFFFCKD